MLKLCKVSPYTRKYYSPQIRQTRSFWEYVNMMFNKPDPARILLVGPDRACAEWVLRNGGKVVWTDGKRLEDYNNLPAEDVPVPKLKEIDGSDSSISHYGFAHLAGCTKLEKIILHNGNYIDDRALKGLSYGKDTLTYVQVTKCVDVHDSGIKELQALRKLQTLILYDLINVENLEACKQYLKSQLPNCDIQGMESIIE
ncbi:ATP synthase subunit s, mitochondrial [Hyposmocoma kahamanoa]|uniref:ATP synthase subunit s, mitochondrial n=1 Tax=Hyposmocoma kahamanoa TaxID=1477025 RepID=UPI000E6DA3FF|nr:ATP synthase subunit s, mitochondrial [Hyposmocoma kahamanoa]